MTRGSIFFVKKMDCRVKPGNGAEVDQFDREPRFQWPLAGAASRPMTINTLVSGLSLSGLRRALAVRLDFVQGGRASGMNALSRATRGDGIPRASRQIATTRETAPAL